MRIRSWMAGAAICAVTVGCGERRAANETTEVPITKLPVTSVAGTAGEPAAPIPAGAAGLLPRYEAIRLALAGDTMTGVAEHAAAILAEKGADAAMAAAAEKVAAAKDPASARAPFDELSKAAIARRNATKDAGFGIFYCPMVNKSWLQAQAAPRVGNPYDPGMPECGYEVDEKGEAIKG